MQPTVRTSFDSFGKALRDFQASGEEVVTRLVRLEDGNVEEMPISSYFAPFEEWSRLERALTLWTEGSVLDIGVGAGRLALHLQSLGHRVVGIDVSQGALDVSRARGVADLRRWNILDGPLASETFDTVLLFGQNLGIAGVHANVRPMLEVLKSMLTPGGRIIGNQLNWEKTDKPQHLAFQQANRSKGRHPVEMTLRISYGGIDEDFSWCLTNQVELVEAAGASGLAPEAIIDCGSMYGYVLMPAG